MISLPKKHQKTYEKIFDTPVRSDVAWKDVEAMLTAMGAEITEGNGSRIRVKLNKSRQVFHRPHPQKETDKGALKSVQKFLIKAGVKNA